MLIDLKGKNIAVTGCGSAAGKAIAATLAGCGASVAVMGNCTHCTGSAIAAVEAAGGTAKGYVVDMSSRESVTKAFEQAAADLGGLDVVVNAYVPENTLETRAAVSGCAEEQWEKVTRAALDGAFRVAKAAEPLLEKRGGGSIINLVSEAGIVPAPTQGASGAAGAGVVQLSKTLAIELGPKNIRVNVLAMGMTEDCGNRSEETKAAMLSHIPMHRTGTVQEFANTAAFLCTEMGAYVTGVVMNVDGGWACGYGRDF